MSQSTLFTLPQPNPFPARLATRRAEARVVRPVRQQVQWQARDLDSFIGEGHLVRTIWGLLEVLDLDAFYGSIKTALSRPGRPASDPQVLLALWVFASAEDVGSARQLARLCQEHDAYRWLRGGVPINYHMLADFRVANEKALDGLLTQILASLKLAGALPLDSVAQDGMRVRASAGAASFRRKDKLEMCMQEATAQVQRLAELRQHPDPGLSKRQQRARERAAREQLERAEQAMARLPELEASKELQKRQFAKAEREKIKEPRASTTDPESRVMKMPDGGYRPAYNVQFATDSSKGIIVGVGVTASGSDAGQALPMAEQIERRTGQQPKDYLMDGGFTALKDITALEGRGISVYAPVRLPKSKPEEQRYQPRYGDSPEVVAWRKRMATEEAKKVYRQRAATAEWANAQVRQHGISQFNVRGLAKVTSVVLLATVTHNLLRWATLAT